MKGLSKTGIWAILLTSCLTIMVGTVIAPSLPEISVQLGFTEHPGWLITLPALGVVLFAPISGRLIDRKGTYTMMCWGLIPYGIFGVSGFLLKNPYLLIADRLLLGAATATLQAAGSGMIAEFFQGKGRMKMIAWQGMAIELGGVVFLSLGGVLGQAGWKFPFFIYLFSFVCFVLVLIGIPKKDLKLEIVAQESGESPTSKSLLHVYFGSSMSMILFFTAFVGLPLILPKSFGFSPEQTGYFMALISLVAVAAASLMPLLAKHLQSSIILLVGFLGFAAGLFMFSANNGLVVLFGGAVATGVGFGFTVPTLNLLTINGSSTANLGSNLGYYSMAIFGGQFLSSFIGFISPDVRLLFLIAAWMAILVSFFQISMVKRRFAPALKL